MKSFVCLSIIAIIVFVNNKMQAQSYKPIGFDTSCYWISYWHLYSGGTPIECNGARIAKITKDTLIDNKIYWKVEDCPVKPLQGTISLCYTRYYKTNIAFVREDTLDKVIYEYTFPGEQIIADYKLTINDTMDIGLNNYNPKVDSITNITLYNGDTTIVHHSKFGFNYHYKLMQGLGANYNFIFSGYGEWFTPTYTLQSFTKNQKLIYFDGIDSEDSIQKPC